MANQRTTEVGVTGTLIKSGILSLTDYQANMTGLSAIQKYDKMRKGDGTVRSALKSMVTPITSTAWDVEYEDQNIEDFVEYNLFQTMSITWSQFLEEAIRLYLAYGHMPYEKVYEVRMWKGKPYYMLRKFAPRLPGSIRKWETENNKPGVQQYDPNTGENISIPMEKLVVFVCEKEGDNWQGVSVLRSAYKHWYMKDTLYKIDAVKGERQGLGIPYAKIEGGKTLSQAEVQKVEEQLANMRAHEKAFAIIPDGVEMGFFDMKAGATHDLMPSISHHDRQITKNVLAQFLEIGSASSSGSYSASNDQIELFMMSLNGIAQYFKETIERYFIKELVDLNFGPQETYPQITFEQIGSEKAKGLAETMKTLVDANVIIPTDSDENHFRKMLRLEDREDNGERAEAMAKPVMVAPGAEETTKDTSQQKPKDKEKQKEAEKADELGELVSRLEHIIFDEN